MKKKKNKGCIYWDESSRGVSIDRPRGRWVGERLENGKRVRMRSTNYDNVLKWVMGNNTDCPRRQIKGFPDYFINIERREVFGKRGTPMKGEVRSNRTIYRLKKDKVTYKIPFARIAYAAPSKDSYGHRCCGEQWEIHLAKHLRLSGSTQPAHAEG